MNDRLGPDQERRSHVRESLVIGMMLQHLRTVERDTSPGLALLDAGRNCQARHAGAKPKGYGVFAQRNPLLKFRYDGES